MAVILPEVVTSFPRDRRGQLRRKCVMCGLRACDLASSGICRQTQQTLFVAFALSFLICTFDRDNEV
jgi:hypothetical protein